MFYAAMAGWTLSFIVHLATVFGQDVAYEYPFVLVLHVGIFAIWLPSILKMKKEMAALPPDQQKKGLSIKNILKGLPLWLQIMVVACWIYVIPNFIYSLSNSESADFRDGKYVFHNRGEVIKEISEAEYHENEAMQLRAFSGHWLLFYGMGAAFLFVKKEEEDES